MQYLTAKQYDDLCEELVINLELDFFDDGEIDRILAEIGSYQIQVRQKLLALAYALSHASSSLVPGLLRHVRTASSSLAPGELDDWLNTAFDLRDDRGIDQALGFLSRVDAASLGAYQTRQGVQLREATPLLETFLRAMSGRDLKILPEQEPFTDTTNIYLPAALNRFPGRDENFSLYKLAAANAWAQIAIGTLDLDVDLDALGRTYGNAQPDIEQFFELFPGRRLALDLYTVIESFRTEYFLMKELPGLMKRASEVKHALYPERPRLAALSAKSALVEGLWQYYLTGRIKGTPSRKLTAAVACLYGIQYEPGPRESVRLLFDFYDTAAALQGLYIPRPAPLFVPRIRPDRVAGRLREEREARLKRVERLITQLMEMPELPLPNHPAEQGRHHAGGAEPSKDYLMIKGRLVELDEDVLTLVDEKGGLPGGVLVKGSEKGGASVLSLTDLTGSEAEQEDRAGGISYDEWDYRRGGYRRNWCSLYEHDIRPGREPFVELVLKRHGGAVSIIRKQFELLKRERRLKRRQKDGDGIDLDAQVECFSDLSAGVSPSENVYTRIERQERDIAVLFLVDMSGSTMGWVNEAEKESLVMLSEALEALGDRYAVYGFSSMTRNRCDLFRVKGFIEAYGSRVKRRIAGIEPRDYTRMGPFIRHAARLLGAIDARTRLLITLSDSKPEDWDGYKGDYAIEDTRKALLEAKGQAIHPFCITIDREAQAYLPHLFGEGRYIFIDDVRKLPSRITGIYRSLTV